MEQYQNFIEMPIILKLLKIIEGIINLKEYSAKGKLLRKRRTQSHEPKHDILCMVVRLPGSIS
jgi:hypothetical protein